MSTVPARKSNVVWLSVSRIFGRRRRITDGDLELRVTYELYSILAPLSQSSRERALKHVREIFHEQAVAMNDYEFQED